MKKIIISSAMLVLASVSAAQAQINVDLDLGGRPAYVAQPAYVAEPSYYERHPVYAPHFGRGRERGYDYGYWKNEHRDDGHHEAWHHR